ncbi:hypothetical protein V492_06884 [Pseudogymnoascus sp. VKM F-4246]|nr:hypothetical protein V492_06884 [Pseudogymnoascus sp. VKM F-4246]
MHIKASGVEGSWQGRGRVKDASFNIPSIAAAGERWRSEHQRTSLILHLARVLHSMASSVPPPLRPTALWPPI